MAPGHDFISKTTTTMNALLSVSDKSGLLDFARGLQETYGYGTISEQQFVDAAKAASGFSGAELTLLGDYFQQWLHLDSKPTITPDDFPPPAP